VIQQGEIMIAKGFRAARSAALAGLMVAALAVAAHAPTSLKNAYKGDFVVGAAINAAQITGQDARGDALVESQFNAISPENVLKWEIIHPQPDKYDFDLADKYVAFGVKHHMFVVGHNLVWHNQVPAWIFHDDKGNLLDRDALLARMRDHIHTVVGRYKGKIRSWDVVNEALNDDGTLRQSMWFKIIGPDYIEKAFQYAHEADPKMQLTYNDYNLENEPKRNGAIALIRKLMADGVPIAVVGLQGHYHMQSPTVEQVDAAIFAFAALGIKVAISELDIDVLPAAGRQPTADVSLRIEQNPKLNPYVDGLPDSVQHDLAERYAGLFRVFLKHRDAIERVTFWGVTDGDSWLNDWPVKGRSSYPLLFDRNGQPKPAFNAVIRATAEGAPQTSN
jgi:endo-1,4-beta-xylanase